MREFYINTFSRSIIITVAAFATAVGVACLPSSGVERANGPMPCGPGLVPVVEGGVWACKPAPVDPGRHRHFAGELTPGHARLAVSK
jgi:hypothetical protein